MLCIVHFDLAQALGRVGLHHSSGRLEHYSSVRLEVQPCADLLCGDLFHLAIIMLSCLQG